MSKLGNTPLDKYLRITWPIIWFFTFFVLLISLSISTIVYWNWRKLGISGYQGHEIAFDIIALWFILAMGRTLEKTFHKLALSDQRMEKWKFEEARKRAVVRIETPWAVDWSDEE